MSSFILKILAVVTMTVDHIGVLFFPNTMWLRIIGRLAFPIFAYMIAEGFKYTKSRLNYFLRIFSIGAICQIVYFIFSKIETNFIYQNCIMITFSISIALMQLLELTLNAYNNGDTKQGLLYSLCLALAIAFTFVLTQTVIIDYGFFGILVPVFISAFKNKWARLGALTVGLILVSLSQLPLFPYQFYCLIAVPLIALYNGTQGKYKLKYFFYLYYPLHLAILEIINFLIQL